MRFAIGLLVLLVLGLGAVSYGDSAVRRCSTGEARAFVSIQKDPPYLVGTIPSSFTSDALYFSRRYNCKRRSVQVRRVGLGLYDVFFPGLDVKLVVASAISDEGITASILPLGNGIVRVALRGPLGGGDVASRRDVPFSVVIF